VLIEHSFYHGLLPIDPLDLAWCAGFFDGEGSTIARTFAGRPGYRQLTVNVPQAGRHGVPEVLLRFQRSMLGMGAIGGPNKSGMYCWRVFGREPARLTLDLMWPYLGETKRRQARAAIEVVDAQYESGAYRRRAPRRPAPPAQLEAVAASPELVERAWAAGFLDAEGCFGLNRAGKRVRGADWYRVRASASQHGTVGAAPGVLLRLQAALGGRIQRHGEPDDYKWLVEGPQRLQVIIDLLSQWMSEEKRTAAIGALSAFHAQRRFRGDGIRCLRGHSYSRIASRGGRLRKICGECARMYRRAASARLEPPMHQLEEVARRYTYRVFRGVA
jgi:hypothetical protein